MVDKKIRDIYEKEASKSLETIVSSLEKLRSNLNDQKAIYNLYRGAHTLKSSSFQMGFFSVGYLAHLMSDMLKEIKMKKIKMDEKKFAFLSDFAGSLEKAVDNVLKNKKYNLKKSLFDKIDKILEKTETKRLKSAELKISEKIKAKEDLKKYYIETSEELIKEMDNCLKKDKKDFEKEDIVCLSRVAHTLEGNSLQEGNYILAYISSKMHAHAEKIIHGDSKIKSSDRAFILDLLNTIKKYLISIKTNKTIYDKKLMQKINELVKKDYINLEKKLMKNGK